MWETLKLMLPFGIGTLLVITPLGAVSACPGKNMVLFDRHTEYALMDTIILVMVSGFFGIYKFPVKNIFNLRIGSEAN